jgi:ribosomal protein L34E
MVCNTNISIALKGRNGQYRVKDFSIFELNKIVFEFPSFEIVTHKKREISIKLRCPICGEYHRFNYNINEFMKRDMTFGGCETTGMPVFFIGRGSKVSERIRKFNKVHRSAYAMI